jgi:hypothetical protein
MTESLTEKVEQVIWDLEKDAFHPVRALVLQEMRYRIHPGVIWDLQKWARSKMEEHKSAQRRIDNIIQQVRKNVPDHEDHCLSLKKLSLHHDRMGTRYRVVVNACYD